MRSGYAPAAPRASEAVNPMRRAHSLALNELAWWALRRHPQMRATAARYAAAHAEGLALVAEDMARRTAVALEAVRFLEVLRPLLATGRLELIARGPALAAPLAGEGGVGTTGRGTAGGPPSGRWPRRGDPDTGAVSSAAPVRAADSVAVGAGTHGRAVGTGADSVSGGRGDGWAASHAASHALTSDLGPSPERIVGWACPDGSACLLPELARREVERVLGPGGLNGISTRTLHRQLYDLGLIAGHDPGRLTRVIREAGRTHDVLHLRAAAFEESPCSHCSHCSRFF